MNFLHPLYFWFFLPWGLFILWYVLGRRQTVVVPYLLLWEQPTAKKLMHREYDSVLFFLTLALLVFAAAQPFWQKKQFPGLVVLDNGWTMAVPEKKGTRWQEALEVVRPYISDVNRPCIVLCAPQPSLRTWAQVLGRKPEDTAGQPENALAWAQNLASSQQIVVVTDGVHPRWPSLLAQLREDRSDTRVHIVGQTRQFSPPQKASPKATSQKARVLLLTDRPQPYLLAALASYPDLVDKEKSAVQSGMDFAPSAYDLFILAKASWEKALPPGKYFILGTKIPSLPIVFEKKSPQAVLWKVNHLNPLAQSLDSFPLSVKNLWQCAPPRAEDLIFAGSTGPLVWEGKKDSVKYIYAAFSLENSDWPFLSSFPVFLHNCLRWALVGEEKTETDAPSFPSEVAPLTLSKGNPALQTTAVYDKDERRNLLVLALACALCLQIFQWGKR